LLTEYHFDQARKTLSTWCKIVLILNQMQPLQFQIAVVMM
jgi:hypothetical protein